jgi:hypothetical protein
MTINITINIPDGTVNSFDGLVKSLSELSGKPLSEKGAAKASLAPVRKETKSERAARVAAKLEAKYKSKTTK